MTVGAVLFWRDLGDGFADRDIARIVLRKRERAGWDAELSGLCQCANQWGWRVRAETMCVGACSGSGPSTALPAGLATDATQHDASVMSGRIGCAFRLVAR